MKISLDHVTAIITGLLCGMSQTLNKSIKTAFFSGCVVLSLILIAGCVSQVPSSNSTVIQDSLRISRVLNATNGSYSVNTTVTVVTGNIMTYSIEKPNYSKEWVSSLAKKLGMSEDIRETEYGFFVNTSEENKFSFHLEKDRKYLLFIRRNAGSLSGNLTDNEKIVVVKDFLKSMNLMSDAEEPRVVYGPGIESLSRSGQLTQTSKQVILVFSRQINGLPVWSPKSMITVNDGGIITDIGMSWPDYQPSKTVTLRSPEQAFVEFQTEKLYYPGSESKISPEKIVVTNISLGYSSNGGKYFQPVYLFEGYGQQGNKTWYFNPIEISASDEELN